MIDQNTLDPILPEFAKQAGFVQAGGKMREGGVVSSSRAVLYPPAAQSATTIAAWRAAIGDAMAAAASELRAACTP